MITHKQNFMTFDSWIKSYTPLPGLQPGNSFDPLSWSSVFWLTLWFWNEAPSKEGALFDWPQLNLVCIQLQSYIPIVRVCMLHKTYYFVWACITPALKLEVLVQVLYCPFYINVPSIFNYFGGASIVFSIGLWLVYLYFWSSLTVKFASF